MERKRIQEHTFDSLEWPEEFYNKVVEVLFAYKCKLKIVKKMRINNSYYLPREKTVYLGAIGKILDVSSTFLHEVGHHILRKNKLEYVEEEIVAWQKAEQLAVEFKLPFSQKIREDSLRLYLEISS